MNHRTVNGGTRVNILHMRYAVEVARAGSISRASETLYMNQPNLSRAIRDLEGTLGITLFERTARGMVPTPEGEVFLERARRILGEIDEMEAFYREETHVKQRFSACVPPSCYVAEAFMNTLNALTADPAELDYRETGAAAAIRAVAEGECRIGIARCTGNYFPRFRQQMEAGGLFHERIVEFTPVLAYSKDSPLASADPVTEDELKTLIEVAPGDFDVPSMAPEEVRREQYPDGDFRRVLTPSRAARLEILSVQPQSYVWTAPLTPRTLSRYGLEQRTVAFARTVYRDELFYRRDLKLTDMEKRFLTELCDVRREVFRAYRKEQ